MSSDASKKTQTSDQSGRRCGLTWARVPRELGVAGGGREPGQLWLGLVEPRAEEVMFTETPVDHPVQDCPAGLTRGSFSLRQLGTGLGRKGGDCVSWQSRVKGLGDGTCR